jgi:hypothetical protein
MAAPWLDKWRRLGVPGTDATQHRQVATGSVGGISQLSPMSRPPGTPMGRRRLARQEAEQGTCRRAGTKGGECHDAVGWLSYPAHQVAFPH